MQNTPGVSMGKENRSLEQLDALHDQVCGVTTTLYDARETMEVVESVVSDALQRGGISDDAAKLAQVIADHITQQTGQPEPVDLGLESLVYSDPTLATEFALNKVQAALESIDADLQVSTEGLFDIFRSQNAKNREWIEDTKEVLNDLRYEIVKSDVKTCKVKGITEREGFSTGAQRTMRALDDVLSNHGATLLREAKEVAKVAERLRNGNTEYQLVSNAMRGIKITGPNSKREFSTGLLLGGSAVRLYLSGTKSICELEKDKESVDVDVSGEDCVTAIADALKLLVAMSKAVEQNDRIEKEVDRADDKGTTKAILYGFFFGEYAQYSPDFNRRIRRIWGKDKQDAKSKEVQCSFALIKNAMTAARTAVDEIVSVAKKF